MIYVGWDLHKGFSVIAATNSRGDGIIKQRKFPDNGEIFPAASETWRAGEASYKGYAELALAMRSSGRERDRSEAFPSA